VTDAELVREVIKRDGRCRLCGRPDQLDAWRHSEAGLAGDGPDNFTALCAGCMSASLGVGIRPARYVVHVRRPGDRVRLAAANGLAAAILVGYGGIAGLSVYLVARMPHDAYRLPAATATGLLLLMFLALVVRGLLDRWRREPDADHHERGGHP